MAAVEHSAVHPVGVQMLLGDRYPGCAARPWATMFNRVAVVVRAIAKFWNLELGTWNLEPGTSTWVAGRSQRRAFSREDLCALRCEWNLAFLACPLKGSDRIPLGVRDDKGPVGGFVADIFPMIEVSRSGALKRSRFVG